MTKYNEILRLKKMLEDANIPFRFIRILDGYSIVLNSNIDAIEHKGSYGNEDDLLEIRGALTPGEYGLFSVKGHLTAEEVFKRFKYCYEYSTSIYGGD